jgi:aminoglycoside phosphotransferase (APT) family kinase protein
MDHQNQNESIESSAPEINKADLDAYLRHNMPEAEDLRIDNLMPASGGVSREHYNFDLCWTEKGQSHQQELILIRNSDRPAQTDRGKEFRLLRALVDTPVPVPKVHWCDEDGGWLSRPFIIMERVGGSVTPPFTPIYPGAPELRREMMEQFVDILCDLHAFDWHNLDAGTLDIPTGEVSEFAADALNSLEQVLRFTGVTELDPVIGEAITRLSNSTPLTDRLVLCHGDYKPDNILHENGKILAIVDWERAAISDPMHDLAYTCVAHLRVEGLASGLAPAEQIIERYQGKSGKKVEPVAVFFWQIHLLLQTVLYFHLMNAEAGEDPSPHQWLIDHLIALLKEELN